MSEHCIDRACIEAPKMAVTERDTRDGTGATWYACEVHAASFAKRLRKWYRNDGQRTVRVTVTAR